AVLLSALELVPVIGYVRICGRGGGCPHPDPAAGPSRFGRTRDVCGCTRWSLMPRNGPRCPTLPDRLAGDNGTLSKATGGGLTTYTYTRPDGSTQVFDTNGKLVKATSSDGFAAITYTYTSGNLTGLASPDGALTTLTLAAGKVTTLATASRTISLTQTGSD